MRHNRVHVALLTVIVLLLTDGTIAAQTFGSLARQNVHAAFGNDGQSMWYSVNVPGGFEYYKVDLESGEKSPLLDVQKLQAALANATGQKIGPADLLRLRRVEVLADGAIAFDSHEARWRFTVAGQLGKLEGPPAEVASLFTRSKRSNQGGEAIRLRIVNQTALPIQCVWFATDASQRKYQSIVPGNEIVQPTYAGHVWSLRDDRDRELLRFAGDDQTGDVIIDQACLDLYQAFLKPSRTKRKPKNQRSGESRRVSLQQGNLWFAPEEGDKVALTEDADDRISYRSLKLSPSGRYAAALRDQRPAEERVIRIVESSPRQQTQPIVHELQYTKPGDEITQTRIVLFDLETRQAVDVPHDLMENPWRIDRLQWLADRDQLTCRFNQRGHQVLRLFRIDPVDATVVPIAEEASDTFIHFGRHQMRWIAGESQLLWSSQRDGFRHLYRYDVATGQLINQVTQGSWVVREVIEVDEASETILFSASGIVPGQDPYYLHLCRVQFDGSELTVLTEGDGTHRWEFSEDRRWLIDRFSRVDLPTVTQLRRASDGGLVCELERGDCQAMLDSGWTVPERFVAKGRDGETDIYGIIIRPANFDPSTKYPILENIYAGPHDSFCPKAFDVLPRDHQMANLGFIVVRIDGMGTANRGKKFHDVCWKNLADAGFPDRKLWIRAAAKKHPEMDIERVGIYGGSAGGQSAMRALIDHHDLYDVAVADCGCHDNRMDKIWWNEQWMGWPVDASYADSSNVDHAHRMQGKLMLIVGEIDKNVDPASTMQVADALIQADKDFELLVMPSVGHGAAETPYANRRRAKFLVRNLQGRELE
ncbi:Prolyl tripeptidyl peptidase precursor [Rosistilla ulvae]|uniref:Prolyl tripeptidyl peptidase n=1 Tax=Rosistilla ulvae TaxID=1930277 RepID=A0A517M373_9BACT|nr:prolyl oligopeptidase family serine peptidase [Rosistilla ulvae]QDS89299.1 Prolyl tripeptidyl peptidase precursor [Rosistilla ulvae]